MYAKNLTEDFRLRLSTTDMDFLKSLSEQRGVSISEVVRGLIGEYRRSLDAMEVMKQALELVKQKEGVQMFNGNTETDIVN